MLDHAADEEQAVFRQAGIFIASESRLAVAPDRHMNVHARTVVAKHRLRHEGRRLAVGVGDLVHDILVDLHLVGVANQRVELQAEFVLGSRNLVVMLLNTYAHLGEHGQHLGTHVLRGVDRRNREIAALDARAVAHIAGLIVSVVVGRQLGRVQLKARVVGVSLVLHIVEDEELGFRTDEDRVAHAFGLHIGFGLLRRAAWIAIIGFAGNGIEDVAHHNHGGLREERVHVDRVHVGHEHHVGLIDGLPAADGRAVEHDAVGEHVFVNFYHVHRDVVHLALRISEAQVNELNLVVLDLLHDVIGCRHVVFPVSDGDGCSRWSDGVDTSFARTNSHDFFDIGNKNLAVTDATSLGGIANGINRGFNGLVVEHHLDLHLRQEVHDVFGATVKLRVAFLTAEALCFGDRDALEANFLKRFLDLVQFERLDDGFDLLHGACLH